MTNSSTSFDHPLTTRYASAEMQRLFSPAFRYTAWRRLWLTLAEAEQELGIEIPDEALQQMRANLEVRDDDLERVKEYERQTRHDVMAHLHAFADRAPAAKPFLHPLVALTYGLQKLGSVVREAFEV